MQDFCACTGSRLFLVGKLGFSLSSKYTKRAGLDYWDSVDLHKVNSMEELFKEFPDGRFFYLTTKTKENILISSLKDNDFVVFGPESRGLPAEYVTSETALTIPIERGTKKSKFIKLCINSSIRRLYVKG